MFYALSDSHLRRFSYIPVNVKLLESTGKAGGLPSINYKACEDKKWNEIKKYATDFAKELKDRIITRFKSNFNVIRSCESCDESNSKDIEIKLNSKGITHYNVYLFVRGHTLYDHGIKQLVRLIVKILININDSQNYNKPESEKKGFYNYYNDYNPHDNIFPQGVNCECNLIDNIKNDIKNFINDPNNKKVWGLTKK